MNKHLTLIAAALATVSSIAAAAPQISAQSIIVNPAPSTDVSVKVWVDRDTSGTRVPNYRIGDRIRIYTSTDRDAYVYLFNVNPDGSIDQILPNHLQSGGNFVKANTVKAFPSARDQFVFNVAGPYGTNKVLALASTRPLNLQDISSFQGGQSFAQVKQDNQQEFAQALSIVVNPVPQNSWITDVAYYNVAR
ncbi:DUF4384 domain-containing protein [Deinococcus maricopensis]|uniref:S-layer-like protein array-related protein n=1 Tax=Deinococcus maricopensis (strain DSM 21211 / LMG 22137 / NRRL B-23946 / LB-34) TaxID=709986 RepID=E8U5N8_DEIML|nr:DUF4384 domain-containing protein [Deinococcus maricopensis]ADV66377.1 S-layer-like protein array-related protein [Deinococcus maricopensis DSM 21211]